MIATTSDLAAMCFSMRPSSAKYGHEVELDDALDLQGVGSRIM